MDVRFSMVRVMLTAATGCMLALGSARAEDPASPAADASKAAPPKDLNQYAPGLLDQRLRLPGKTVDVPLGTPAPSEPSISRKDWLRMRDRQEEKKNWMFVEPGSLTKEREEKEESNYLKDKWDTKEDGKKKSWWEYGSSDKGAAGASAGKGGAGLDKKERIAAEQELRMRMQRDRDDGSVKGRSITSGMELSGKGKDSGESAHQSGELSLKDLFGGPGSESKSGSGSASSAWDMFPGDGGGRDRELSQSQSRRQEFRDFLNSSRVAKSSPSEAASSASGSSALSSFGASPINNNFNSADIFGNSARAASGRDGFGGASDFGRPPAAPSSSSFSSGFQSPSGGSGFGGNSPYGQQQPSYRSSYETREYITPQMMNTPKRRF